MDIAMQIEDMECEAERLSSLLVAVEAAIYGGIYDYRKFESALSAVSIMAEEHKKNLETLTAKVYEQKRTEKEGQVLREKGGSSRWKQR